MSTVLTYMMQSGSPVEWAGAIGSILAGLVALLSTGLAFWLAFDARQSKLRGHCCVLPNHQYTIPFSEWHSSDRDAHPRHDRFLLRLKNVGGMPTNIFDIRIRIGRFKNKRISPSFFNEWLEGHPLLGLLPGPGSSKLPANIAGGEEKEWTFSLKEVAQYITAPNMLGHKMVTTKTEAKTVRFLVYTSFGKPKIIKPKDPVINAIIKSIEENRNITSA